jgi:hypothetical protein
MLMLFLIPQVSHAQFRVSKHFTQRVDSIDLSDENYILRDKEGFTAFLPQKGKAVGAIIFFMGRRVDSNSKIKEMSILMPAIKKNIAVIFLTSGNHFDFYFEERDLEKIDSTLQDCIKRTKVPKNKLMFAGDSLAGLRAMKYAVFCEKEKSKFGIHPAAIAISDAPLDMIRFWNENKKAAENDFDGVSKNAGLRITQYMLIGLGGIPEIRKEKFIENSPYCHSEKDSSNVMYLSKIPARAYFDGDVVWWIENMRKDFYSLSAIDMAGYINQVKLFGNTNAKLISPVKKKGSDDAKVETWSLIDFNDLIEWFADVIGIELEKK